MPRRTADALEKDTVEALIEALNHLGIDATVLPVKRSGGEAPAGIAIDVAGRRFDVETKSVLTAARENN